MLAGRTENPSLSGVKSRFGAISEPLQNRDYVLVTTNSEQQQAIWYVSGLAEVLASPGLQGEADDAIVRFDRYRRNSTPVPLNASPNTLGRTARRRLDQWGYVLVEGVESPSAAEELVCSVGELIPQYTGLLTHEVTYRPGNDDRSQSANVTSARTAAPGWQPSPAYLAFFCHRQARCGGGHTDLLDVRKLVGALDADELALMTDAELHFPGPDDGVDTTMLSTDAGGNTVTRFSYDLLTTSDHHSSPPPLGEAGRGLAHRVSDLFRELRTRVLIPDGALLIWDNQRMLHAWSDYRDRSRHLTRFWSTDWRRA